ncbi:receptor-like protein kinase [Gossypium australe]|uniref:Receptor-like protein kinase n=1 Tax=Gossypium australe TaxID=47621 RepID=A0A5B6X0D2_9ROSI|nr:receptor-like protein kinase [Gossypium australe]
MFISLYEVEERVGPIAYRLKLPRELDKIQDVFYVSKLRRYCTNPYHAIAADEVEVQLGLTYEEDPVNIVACESN